MAQSIEKANRYQSEIESLAQEKRFQEELSRLYTDICHARHDVKQHFQVLEEMVATGGNEQAAAYLKGCRSALERDNMFWTGSSAVDALILSKSLSMKQKGIHFHYASYPLTKTPIAESSFCSILGNLLDNAIEGVLRLPAAQQPYTIQLTMSQSWDMFYIFCTNPCDLSTMNNANGQWKSSKEMEGVPGLHGVGIRSIQRLVNASEGRSSFDVVDGSFVAKIVLPCEPLVEGT